MKEFFNITQISTAEGSVDLDLKLNNSSWSEKALSMNELIDMKPDANLVFNSLDTWTKK